MADQQGSLGIKKVDILTTGKLCNVHGPGAAGVYILAGPDIDEGVCPVIPADSCGNSAVFNRKTDNFSMRTINGVVEMPGVGHIEQRQPEWINGCVRNPVSLEDFFGEERFEFSCLCNRDRFTTNSCRFAEISKALSKTGIVTFHRNKETICLFDALRSYMFEESALFPAFDGRVDIIRDISAAGVEETVVSTGGTCAEILSVDQQNLQSPKCEIAHDTCTGNATTDYKDIGFNCLFYTFLCHGFREGQNFNL